MVSKFMSRLKHIIYNISDLEKFSTGHLYSKLESILDTRVGLIRSTRSAGVNRIDGGMKRVFFNAEIDRSQTVKSTFTKS